MRYIIYTAERMDRHVCRGGADTYDQLLEVTGKIIERFRHLSITANVMYHDMATGEWVTMYDHDCGF